MALWWRRKVDFLRSYLLVSFGQVIYNLTSLTFFKRLANEFLVTVLEYEQMFFFFQMLLKKYMTSMFELEKNWKIWKNLVKVLSTDDQNPITLCSFFARKICYFSSRVPSMTKDC